MQRRQRTEGEHTDATGVPDKFSPKALKPEFPKAPQVYELMREAIVSLAYSPGAVINEKLICERLEVSRTPVREALLQLHSENLVHVVPNSGTYVSQIDMQRLFDGQLVRDALETRVVQYAARKATQDFLRALDFNMHQQRVFAAEQDYDRFYGVDEGFHQTICEFGASPEVWKIVNGAKAHLDRVRRLAFPERDHLEIVLKEHIEIVSALHKRDPEAAGQAMQAHVGRVFETIRHLLGRRPEFFATNAKADFEELASSRN